MSFTARAVRVVAVAFLVWTSTGTADAVPTDTQKCQAKKLAAAGRYTSCRVNAEATFIKTGDAAKRAEKLAKCAASFAEAIMKADEKWGTECPASPPTGALDSFLTECSDDATAVSGGDPLPAFCGDGSVNACGEECDGTDLAGNTCVAEGFPGGTLGCTSACVLDTSTCNPVPTTRCCQISGITACTDVLPPGDDCAAANSELQALPFGVSAALAAVGTVCNGATGLCAAERTGVTTCCQINSVSFNTCAEGPDPGGAICNAIESFVSGGQTTSFAGYRCVGTETGTGSVYNCVP